MESQRAKERPSGGSTLLGVLCAAFSAACWSGNHIVGRAIAQVEPPLAIGSIRWIVPALILAPFAVPYLRRDWAEIQQTWRTIVVLALIGGAIFGSLQFVGLGFTTALNVSVLNSVAPVLIVAAGWLLYSDRVGWAQALGIGISLTGVLAIIAKGQPQALAAFTFNAGDLIILFNMGLWAIYSASLRSRGTMHWVSFTFLLAAISALATLPAWFVEHNLGRVLTWTWPTGAALAFIALFPSLLAYASWSKGVEILGSGRAGAFLHLIPLFSALVAGAALGEQIEVYHLAGFALILAGVALASRRSSL